ncbi:MAG: hypothetical protein K2O74_02230, partial [Eubacteriales bacterium]|nr:hypothetical protein [Eubacteriales bacterium]
DAPQLGFLGELVPAENPFFASAKPETQRKIIVFDLIAHALERAVNEEGRCAKVHQQPKKKFLVL